LSFEYMVITRPCTGHSQPASPDAGDATSSRAASAAVTAMIDLCITTGDASAPRVSQHATEPPNQSQTERVSVNSPPR
jgi:hypothetical protein